MHTFVSKVSNIKFKILSMGVTIHPHKGYLNTNFNVNAIGSEFEYSVYKKGDSNKCPIIKDIVKPNKPHVLNIAQAGDFIVQFNNADEISIHIEDGYKFGGSSYKTSFIFDKCPWCFVIMHDRTYFYNRKTKRSFVEPISPDKITEINKDFVIFENDGQKECTIFSLIEEKPVLCISNIITFNDSVVVWEECIDDKHELCICILGAMPDTIDKFEFDGYSVDKELKNIIFYTGNTIKEISLLEYQDSTTYEITVCGKIVCVVAPNIVVSYRELYCRNELTISDLYTEKVIKTIQIDGFLAEINDNILIDTWGRQQLLSKFDVSSTGIPELKVSASYKNIFIYPCDWDVFYSIETISLLKDSKSSIKRTSKSKLYSVNTGIEIDIQQAKGKSTTYGNAFCFYNGLESFVRSAIYDGDGYNKGGDVYLQGNNIYWYKDSRLYQLSRNGYWDNSKEIKLDFSKFDEFGVVKNKETDIYQTLDGKLLGKCRMQNYIGEKHMLTTEYYIFSNTRKLKSSVSKIPSSLSNSLEFGIYVYSGCVFLCNLQGEDYTLERIMEDVYDSTEYKDVLLSEDGNCFMYKDGDNAITFNINTGESQIYDNLSYIKHVNGVRPLFSTPTSLQPILINPVSKQRIDAKEMSNYQFISPDGKLYADTRLKEYIEYYYLETNILISNDKFREIRDKYTYPWIETDGSTGWEIVKNARKQLILENFKYLNEKYPKLFKNDLTGEKWDESVLDTKNKYGVELFLRRLFGVRGIAVIRNSYDDSEFTRIDLGAPLMYINYVSFSYDSKYVAIAGYRNSGGLFIIYDLESKNTIVRKDTERAVWNVTFSANNALASYTSNPKTFFAANTDEYLSMCEKEKTIERYNFLTFSPDGVYFALSQQGYISKYDINGNARDNWGHQPSSVVEIRRTIAQENTLIEYSDLSDSGISDTSHCKSVASVSFSNDNKRLMMVGNDGVVIIRNLHLEDYACK